MSMTELEAVTATWQHLRGRMGIPYGLTTYWRDRKDELEAADQEKSPARLDDYPAAEHMSARIITLGERLETNAGNLSSHGEWATGKILALEGLVAALDCRLKKRESVYGCAMANSHGSRLDALEDRLARVFTRAQFLALLTRVERIEAWAEELTAWNRRYRANCAPPRLANVPLAEEGKECTEPAENS